MASPASTPSERWRQVPTDFATAKRVPSFS